MLKLITQEEWNKLKSVEAYRMYVDLYNKLQDIRKDLLTINKKFNDHVINYNAHII